MGRVTIKPKIGRDIALMFGPEITLETAEKAAVMVKAQMGPERSTTVTMPSPERTCRIVSMSPYVPATLRTIRSC